MTDEKVSQDAKSVQCARIFMYLENCIQRNIDDKIKISNQDIRGNVNNINLQSEENRLKIN